MRVFLSHEATWDACRGVRRALCAPRPPEGCLVWLCPARGLCLGAEVGGHCAGLGPCSSVVCPEQVPLCGQAHDSTLGWLLQSPGVLPLCPEIAWLSFRTRRFPPRGHSPHPTAETLTTLRKSGAHVPSWDSGLGCLSSAPAFRPASTPSVLPSVRLLMSLLRRPCSPHPSQIHLACPFLPATPSLLLKLHPGPFGNGPPWIRSVTLSPVEKG